MMIRSPEIKVGNGAGEGVASIILAGSYVYANGSGIEAPYIRMKSSAGYFEFGFTPEHPNDPFIMRDPNDDLMLMGAYGGGVVSPAYITTQGGGVYWMSSNSGNQLRICLEGTTLVARMNDGPPFVLAGYPNDGAAIGKARW
jgi:hypothetical protein